MIRIIENNTECIFRSQKSFSMGIKRQKKTLTEKVNIARQDREKYFPRNLFNGIVTLSKTRQQMQINLTFFVVRAERANR